MGFPKDLLTDQGTPFVLKLIFDVYQLLQLKQFRMSMHHPQKDGLIGKFNQTLKRMHRRVVEEDGRNWDFLLPYVLFPI